MRVFETGDRLRLGFELADERRVIGELGQDDLDGYFPADRRLEGAIDRAESTGPDLLAKVKTAELAGR